MSSKAVRLTSSTGPMPASRAMTTSACNSSGKIEHTVERMAYQPYGPEPCSPSPMTPDPSIHALRHREVLVWRVGLLQMSLSSPLPQDGGLARLAVPGSYDAPDHRIVGSNDGNSKTPV